MSDLISRQAAIGLLKKAYWNNDIQSAKDDPCIVDAMVDWAIRQIKSVPAIEAEPVKHGRWKEIDYPWHECSECGERTAVVNLNGKVVWNYCPNCGAKMNEVEE